MNDNFGAAVESASGEYITFLSDDDVHSSVMLEKAHELIKKTDTKLVVFQMARYYSSACNEDERSYSPNTLVFRPFTGNTYRVSGTDAAIRLAHELNLTSRSDLASPFLCPYLINAVYHRSIFETVAMKSKDLFPISPGDIYIAAMTFGIIKEYYCIDLPMAIWNRWGGNATLNLPIIMDEDVVRVAKFPAGEEQLVPLDFAFNFNLGANAFLLAKRDLEPKLDLFQTDWAHYFIKSYEHLIYLESRGLDVEPDLEKFYEVVSRQSESIRTSTFSQISGLRIRAKRQLRKLFPAGARFLKRKLTEPNIFLNGTNIGFANLTECADLLNDDFLNSYRIQTKN